MTRPTDDELEAMAQYAEGPNSPDASECAAMLRACKGRVKPAYSLADLNALSPEQKRANRDAAFAKRGWITHDHFEKGLNTALKCIASIGYGKNQDVDEGHEEAYRAVEAYLKDWKSSKPAALDPAPDQGECMHPFCGEKCGEPAPDHEIWNAAIEAVALAAEEYLDEQIDAKGIRALKKGPPQ